jgi:hypothetical protein
MVAWAVRLGLWILPFRDVVRLVTWAARGRSDRRNVSARRLAWAVSLASGYVVRSTCLVRAMTGRVMLGRHHHACKVRIGVAKDGGNLLAHAWLEASGGEVLLGGADDMQRYRVISEPCGGRA